MQFISNPYFNLWIIVAQSVYSTAYNRSQTYLSANCYVKHFFASFIKVRSAF